MIGKVMCSRTGSIRHITGLMPAGASQKACMMCMNSWSYGEGESGGGGLSARGGDESGGLPGTTSLAATWPSAARARLQASGSWLAMCRADGGAGKGRQ